MLSSISGLSKTKLDRISQALSGRRTMMGSSPLSLREPVEIPVNVAPAVTLSVVDLAGPFAEMASDDLEEDEDGKK